MREPRRGEPTEIREMPAPAPTAAGAQHGTGRRRRYL